MFLPAHAQSADAAGGSLSFIITLALFFVVVYLMIILPQQRKTKRHRQMLSTLEKGSEVVTVGGVLGRVVELHDSFVTLDVGSGTRLTFQRQSIQSLLPKGTIDSI